MKGSLNAEDVHVNGGGEVFTGMNFDVVYKRREKFKCRKGNCDGVSPFSFKKAFRASS